MYPVLFPVMCSMVPADSKRRLKMTSLKACATAVFCEAPGAVPVSPEAFVCQIASLA